MSISDQSVAALNPPVSEEKRRKAHADARAAATRADWLSQVLDHHEQIEAAFAETKAANSAETRRKSQHRLAALLVAHAVAEEGVLYPALARAGELGRANIAYIEEAGAKMRLAALEHLNPMGVDYIDELGRLEGAVLAHMYQEESNWFVELKEKVSQSDQAVASRRYAEEYGRYMIGVRSETELIYERRSFAPPDRSI